MHVSDSFGHTAPVSARQLAIPAMRGVCGASGIADSSEVSSVYDKSFSGIRWGMQNEAMWRPPTDVYETDDTAIVIVEIAGVSEGDYQIQLTGRLLVVSGERRDLSEKLGYQQMEIRYGRFRTEVRLPWPLENSGQTAVYEDGFLKITMKKAKSRRVPIQVAGETDQGAPEG